MDSNNDCTAAMDAEAGVQSINSATHATWVSMITTRIFWVAWRRSGAIILLIVVFMMTILHLA